MCVYPTWVQDPLLTSSSHVCPLVDEIPLEQSERLHQPVARPRLHAFWPVLRLLRWQGCKVEAKILTYGPGVGFLSRSRTRYAAYHNFTSDDSLGLFRCLSCSCRIRAWLPNIRRSAHTIILCAVWFDTSGQIQCHSGGSTQRRDWKVQVLRRDTHTICLLDHCLGARRLSIPRLDS